jgi:hypothetical protein
MMTLHWYQWMALAALGICLALLLMHFLRLVRLGNPDYNSRPAGKTGKAIRYAFTGAMSPARKESAFLHLPNHTGTFFSFFLFFFLISGLLPAGPFAKAIAVFLGISALCGIAILFKRIIKKELRVLSNPDDFISNFLVSKFQIVTIAALFLPAVRPSYYIIFTILVLYIPVGKLRHAVYFFAARYHIGYFFGWRGVWPPKKLKN